MALALHDRVQETTTTAGTGPITLLGAVAGFQTFAVIGDGNTCYYTLVDGTAWEVGIGTYSTSGPTLARTTVLSNSNANTSPITLSSSANTKTVFVTYPAEKSVNLDASGNVSALGTVSSGTWQGSTVGVAYGGTGVTASSGANSVVLRDSNETATINRVNQGVTITTSSGGTLALTASASYWQTIVGTNTHVVKMPDATTLPVGAAFVIDNDSTQSITVVDYATGALDTIAPGGYTYIYLEFNSTVAGTWNRAGLIPSEVNWGTNSLDLGGTTVITNGTWQGSAVQSGYGGTGLTTFTAANYALYSTSASALTAGTLPIVAGGSGQTTAQAAMNAFAGATTSGYYLRGNGTNVVMAAIQAADVPTLNQNTTGTAAGLSSTLAITSGGTGQTTASAAFNALSPITTAGDLIIGNGSNSATRLAIGANNYVLTSNGTTASWQPASGTTKAQAIAYAMTLGF